MKKVCPIILILSICFALNSYCQKSFRVELRFQPDSIHAYYLNKNKFKDPLFERNEVVLIGAFPKSDSTFTGKDTIDILISSDFVCQLPIFPDQLKVEFPD